MSEDQDIWADYTRAIKPVGRKAAKPRLKPALHHEDKRATRQAAEKRAFGVLPVTTGSGLPATVGNALERKREKALRDGSVPIDAKLDLHGLTQAQAFEALATFMQQQVKCKKRFLLIVTGKGRAGAGVIRTQLPNWLGQLPEADRIMALRPAAPSHGGSGAFYVFLRK